MTVKKTLVCDFDFHFSRANSSGDKVKWEIFNFQKGMAAVDGDENPAGFLPIKHACEYCADQICNVLTVLRIDFNRMRRGDRRGCAALPPTSLGRIFIE